MRASSKIGQNNLIASCLLLFDKSLTLSFKTSITETLQKLFDKAEHASSNQEETVLFEQYNLLNKIKGALLDSLSVITKSMPDEITEQISLGEETIKLSLVEDEELEISLAFTQLESVLDIKFTKYLFALEKRLKILFASKNISKDNMPFGVSSVCWIFSQTLDACRSDIPTKSILIELLKKQLILNLLNSYKEIDKLFVNAGILPNIKIESKPIRRKTPTPDPAITSSADNFNQIQNATPGYGGGQAQQQNNPTNVGLSNASSNKIHDKSSDLVKSIFSMMSQGRSENSQTDQVSNIDNSTMDQTLENLSKITSVAAGSTEIDRLKEMIIDDVRNKTGVYYPSLNSEQQNSLDVLGMFYEQVKQDSAIDTNILSSLNAINIPLIRTAIRDNSFFEEEQHPARQYLEKLIHASQKWHGTTVVKKLHKFSSHLASDYDGTNESFESANDDLESYLRLTDRRAKKSEKKWVDAAKGKEKLDISRHIVEEVVENISANAVPDFVKNVIHYVIQDALTLSLLRHGEDSPEWHENINTATTISKLANPDLIKDLTPKQKIESLHHLDQTMDDLGFSDNDRVKTLNNIKECAQAASTNKLEKNIKLEDVATINKEKKNVKVAGSATLEELRKLTDKEKTELTKIKLLPYGTLFDFITNQQRDKIRRKLSWFSPVSNKALFVSLLGNKPYEKSLNSIAIDISRKNIVKVQIEKKKYFDKVLGSIFSKLKNMITKSA